MRAVIQRVNSASVKVKDKISAEIKKGLVIFLCVEKNDTADKAKFLAEKITALRIFGDCNNKMNLCVQEINAELLVISQFTLCARINSGRRPSFDKAAEPELAERLYLEFIRCLRSSRLKVEQGIFREYMTIGLENDGPVTFVLDR